MRKNKLAKKKSMFLGDFTYDFTMGNLTKEVILATLGPDFPLAWPEYMTFSTNPNGVRKYNPEVGLPKDVKSVFAPVGSKRTIVVNGDTRVSTIGAEGDIYIDAENNLYQADWFELGPKPDLVPAPIVETKIYNNANITMTQAPAPTGVSTSSLQVEVTLSPEHVKAIETSQLAPTSQTSNDYNQITVTNQPVVTNPTEQKAVITAYNNAIPQTVETQVQSLTSNTTTDKTLEAPKKSKVPYILGAGGIFAYFMMKD